MNFVDRNDFEIAVVIVVGLVIILISGITYGITKLTTTTGIAESKTKIIPTYRLEVNNNKIDTIWIYRGTK